MNHKRDWIRTGVRLLLLGLLMFAVAAPIMIDRAYADGMGGGQPGTPPCDTCGVGYVPPDEINPDQGLVSRIEILLVTMPVTGI